MGIDQAEMQVNDDSIAPIVVQTNECCLVDNTDSRQRTIWQSHMHDMETATQGPWCTSRSMITYD
jgi:hypothetical protein